MRKTIAMIEGDYSGPEVVREAVKVMKRTADVFGHEFIFKKVLMGGEAIDATGVPLPDETLKECLASDSVLLGAVGGPKYNAVPKDKRPERGLLGGVGIVANTGADSFKFIGRHTNAYSAAANEYAAGCLLRANRPGHFGRKIRIIYRTRAIGTAIQYFMPQPANLLSYRFF